MPLSEIVQGFIASPLDPDQDGKTSLVEWFAFAGLALILVFAWSRVLNRYIFDR